MQGQEQGSGLGCEAPSQEAGVLFEAGASTKADVLVKAEMLMLVEAKVKC